MSPLDLKTVLFIAFLAAGLIYLAGRMVTFRYKYLTEIAVLVVFAVYTYYLNNPFWETLGNAAMYTAMILAVIMVLTSEKNSPELTAFDITFAVSAALTVGMSFLIDPKLTTYINASIAFLALIPAVIYRNLVRYIALGVVGAAITGFLASLLIQYLG